MAEPKKPFLSSSAQLAAFFSSLIGTSAVLTLYQMYQLGMTTGEGTFLLKVTLALLLFICIGLFTVSHYVTQRLGVIAETARTIMQTGNLSNRIPIDRRSDDLVNLSGVLNDMLGEIETLMLGIRTVTDNIAHDLRTPLTRLRNHIEKLREGALAENPEQRRDQLGALIRECDTLLTTFNALLRISNIESGKRHSAFKPIDLEILLGDIVEMYEPLAQEKDIALVFHAEQAIVNADKDLLFQAFANLLDNAIKFTRTSGLIAIRLYLREHIATVEIDDEGPGISPEQRSEVFQRFYRTDESRNTPGVGLGLSLVKAVFDIHRATVSLHEGERKGLMVRVIF